MSTSKTYQQSLADAGSKTSPCLKGVVIYRGQTVPKLQTVKDLYGDALLHYDAKMELMNLILLSIPNDIYNSVDACTSAKDMWKRVERLMRGTIQNKVDRETHFTNKFDQFVVEPGEALVSVYNRFAQLMNDLERNDMHFPIVTINTKFLNSLQPEWLKYVTQVRLAKHLTVDTFDDLFDYLQQFEKPVNVSRAKKLEKSHDPLALVAHTGSSSRNTSSYYVTHPTSVVDYEDEYQQDDVHTNSEDPLASAMLLLARAITQNFSTLTNNRLRTSSNTRNHAIIQGDRVNIQSRNSSNARRNNRRAYVQEEIVEGSNAPNETRNVQRTLQASSLGNTSTVQCYNCSRKGHYARNYPKPRVRDTKYFMEQMLLAKQDEAGVILTDKQNDFLFADASRMEEIKELSVNICLMARIQPADNTSDAGPSYDSSFISEGMFMLGPKPLSVYDKQFLNLCYLLNDYDDVGKLKAKGDIRVFVGYSKESAAFRVYNKRTQKLHESMNVNFDAISEMASKQFSLEPGLSNLNETGKSSNLTVSQVSEISKKDLEDLFHNFYDEYFNSLKIMRSLTTNVETSNNEIPSHKGEVFHEVSEPFQEESSSSSLNDDIQQSSEEVMVPLKNTQSISNNMVPNVNEASSSHNVFNERLKDAYFDASTTFHDPSNIHTFYQPYPHEKKWTKDHPLHKIIGDPKSSVRTRGQLAYSCLFACLLSSIEPANVAKALKDTDWVSAIQDELDQFARLKVWRLVPQPKGKTIIKTKWIFKNKKDESSLVIRNKARLISVGYCLQECIDYDETFSPVARIEAIRLFLVYAAHKDFTVF
ncbi:integrase, catalytic region, zinc finger, CCHC-type containing protein [Tanacetum coccineum]